MAQILHILSASLDEAQRVLNAAMSAGFRESGAMSLGSAKTGEANPMVAVRSAGYSFDTIIGYQDQEGHNLTLIDESHLRTLVCIANERFKINFERIARFRAALLESYQPSASTANKPSNPDWEDAEARKRRKREEGLARQQALQAASAREPADATSIDVYDVGEMAQ
jgi:tRNA wybutosine-synthesizing protein 3